MPLKSNSGWTVFFLLLVIALIATGVVLHYYSLAPKTIKVKQCFEIIGQDYKTLDATDLAEFWAKFGVVVSDAYPVTWKATIHNLCQQTMRVTVVFRVYDQNGFQLGLGAGSVTLQGGSTGDASGNILIVKEAQARWISKGIATVEEVEIGN